MKNQQNYLILSKGASNYLDLLKTAWESNGGRIFTTEDLIPFADRYISFTNRGIESKFRKELKNMGLIEYKVKFIRGASRGVFTLTDKCIEYFTWNT